jgi:hypothetical protein
LARAPLANNQYYGDSNNPMMMRVLYIEAYAMVDFDGDGIPEFTAINYLKNLVSPLLNINLITKGIKLLEKPEPNMLRQQLEIIYTDLKAIVELPESMNQLMRLAGI